MNSERSLGLTRIFHIPVTLSWKELSKARYLRDFLFPIMFTLLLALPTATFALDPTQSIFQYNCQTWTRQSGLAASGISAITQTREGFIWLGTQKGIVRYDGVEFKILTLPQTRLFQHQAISSLFGSADGELWFGILNGAFGLYRQEDGFSAVTNQPWITPDMRVSIVREVADGSVWVSSFAGTVRWNTQSNSIQSFNIGNTECLASFEDSRHRVWFSMLGGGVFYYEGGQMIAFPDPALTNRNTIVFGITEDLQGQIWMATQAGVRVYDATFNLKQSPSVYPKILRILTDRHGTVWLGSDGNGLFCYRDGKVSVLRKSDGLADDHLSALFEDREGNLWVGTRSGLNLLSDVKFPIYSPEIQGTDLKGNGTAAFHAVCTSSKTGIWASASTGLYHFDGARFTYYDQSTGLESSWLKQVFEAKDGDLYIGTGAQGLEIFRDGKVLVRHRCENWTTGLAEDGQGVVLGVGERLFRVNRAGITPYAFTNDAPAFGWIHNLAVQRDGAILVASANGLFCVKDGAYRRFGTENGLAANDVLWVCEDRDGVLWAGLAGGIARIEGQSVESWTRENGLFDDYVRAIVADDDGWLWVHSGAGIFRIRRSSFSIKGSKAERLICETFDGMDAVKTLETADVEYSACRTADGRIWIPSPQGIIMIDPKHLPTNAVAPLVHIESTRVNGHDWRAHKKPVTRPGKGELEVQYTAPTFLSPHKVHFRYMLEGYDTEWVDAGVRRSAFYTNLKPGKYRFLVEAAHSDWSGIPAAVDIDLPPHFYQTAWFYALCAGILFSSVGGMYLWRIRHLENKQRVLHEANNRLEAEVQKRTSQLAEANGSLYQRTTELETEIEHREKMQVEIDHAHKELLEASRQAGMAEVATSVLHNVGNVLNSVNIATTVLTERLKNSKIGFVARSGQLMADHANELADFLTRNPKGQQLPQYLLSLGEQLKYEQTEALQELASLEKNVSHIKEIVAAQQSYAKVSGLVTKVNLQELITEALCISELNRSEINVIEKQDAMLGEIVTDRHKVMQIVVNLLSNAKWACNQSGRSDTKVIVSTAAKSGTVSISVADNGIGIPKENLIRIFNYGFTTKQNGHGFGLHSSSLAARELGGLLLAQSDGPGHGACFTLNLPSNSKN